MAKLLGFQKRTTETDNKALGLLEKTYLNRTPYGEFSTTDEVDGFINTLSKLPQTVEIQSKIADLQNKKLQMGARLNDIASDKNLFDTDLQAALAGSAKNNFKNMKGLIGSYAAIYGDASSRYDDEVVSNITKRYGTINNIPQETLDYRKQLQDKAKFYASLFNAYNVKDPKTGEIGMLNPENFAVQIDTNPVNGNIVHLEIVPSGDVKGDNYMRTDVGVNVIDSLPNKKLPVFLRTNNVDVNSEGKPIRGGQLGNISYKEKVNTSNSGNESSGGILEPVKAKTGFFGNPFHDSPEETKNKAIDSMKTDGLKFSSGAYNFDNNDVPNDSVLRMGNRVFYSTGKNGEVLEITGKDSSEKQDNLSKYLQGVGKDPKTAQPYFITKDYLYAPDGTSRVKGQVDSNYFSPAPLPSQPTSFNTTQPSAPSLPSLTSPQSSFFSTPPQTGGESTPAVGGVNRANKPDAPTESVGKSFSVSDVIEKGKSFFRSRISNVV